MKIFSCYLSSLIAIIPLSGYANSPLPTNPNVTHGTLSHQFSDNTLTINQSSDRAIVRYDSFDIHNGYRVLIDQPSSTSALLAKVASSDRSIIDGILQATGNIFISNPNGILFGPNAMIDVNALVATTLHIEDSNFVNGILKFEGDSIAKIENQSQRIRAEDFVAIVANEIENKGSIEANRIVLAGASNVSIDNVYGGKIDLDITGLLGTVKTDGYLVSISGFDKSETARSVIAKAGRIEHSGTVLANAEGGINGGYIDFYGENEVIIEENAVLDASGGTGYAKIASGEEGLTMISGMIDVSVDANKGAGGTVEILGDRVGIMQGAKINASGSTAGGRVSVGSNSQRGNSSEHNASRTYIESGSLIEANAETSGNGGDVIIWADEGTSFEGQIRARGGEQSGNGGFIEISGKNSLNYKGKIDLSAPAGDAGTILFDPNEILVSNSSESDGANLGNILFTNSPLAEPWNVTPAELNAIAGNIILEAHDDIIISDAVNLSAIHKTFTARAGDDIQVNANISTNNGQISLTANDPNAAPTSDAEGLGLISMADGSTISAGDQNIVLSSEGNVRIENLITTGDIIITSTDGSINSVSSDHLISANDLSLFANANSATIGASGPINDINVALLGELTASANSGSGGIFISEVGDLSISNVSANSGNVELTATGSITDNGDVSVDITANHLTLQAANQVDVDTRVSSVDASSTNTGSIILEEEDGIILTDVDTANGSISVIAGGDVRVTDLETGLDAESNDIFISTTSGSIEVDRIVTADDGDGADADVILLANTVAGQSITDADGNSTMIGDVLTLTAQGGIGSSGSALNTTVHSMEVRSTNTGSVFLNEIDALRLTTVSTANGAITISAGGPITATSVTSITDTELNDITLTSTGSGIDVGLIDAGQSAGDVLLVAQGGAITQNGTGATDVLAQDLIATASGGIDVDTRVSSVDASSTNIGSIVLDEADGIMLVDVDTVDGSITIQANGQIAANDVVAGTFGNISLTNSTEDILIGEISAIGGHVTLDSQGSIQESIEDTALDITSSLLTMKALNGIGDRNNSPLDDEGLETQVNSINALNTSTNTIEIHNIGDLELNNFSGLNVNGESILNNGGDILVSVASDLTIASPLSGNGVFVSASTDVSIDADIKANSGNIGIRSDGDGDASGDLFHQSGEISAAGGGILLSGFNIILDDATNSGITQGLSASGNFGLITPPTSDFGISILASNNIIVNETLTSINGSVLLQADAALTEPSLLNDWPVALNGELGPPSDGLGGITFNTDTDGTRSLGAGITAGQGIAIIASDDIRIDQRGVSFNASGTTSRVGTVTSLHDTAGFVALSSESIDFSANDFSATSINTTSSTGDLIISAGFDFSPPNISPSDQQDFAIPNTLGNTLATTDLQNVDINSAAGLEIIQSGNVIVGNLSADWIHVESESGSITASSNSEISAEISDPLATHGDFAIQFDAGTSLTIENGVHLDPDRDNDGDLGSIGLGANTSVSINGRVGTDRIDSTAVEADSITIGTVDSLNNPDHVILNDNGLLLAENGITINVESVTPTDGIEIDNFEIESTNGTILIDADANNSNEGLFRMTNNSRIVADADNSNGGVLTISADNVVVTSETNNAVGVELNAGSNLSITSDEGIVLGIAGTQSTDLNSVGGEIHLHSNGGQFTQADGTISSFGAMNIQVTGDFNQGNDAGGGIRPDAIIGESVNITATGSISIAGNSLDAAIEATGADGIVLTSTGGSISHSGEGDIKSSGLGNVEIDATHNISGDITFSGEGDVITTGGGDIRIDTGVGRSFDQQSGGASIQSDGTVSIGQTRLTGTTLLNGAGISADEAIQIDSSDGIIISNNAAITTNNPSQQIDIRSSGGILTFQNSATLNASGSLTLTGSTIELVSDNGGVEIVSGGSLEIDATSGNLVIGQGGASGSATDLQAGGAAVLDALGEIIQNNGSMNINDHLAIGNKGTTRTFTQGVDAGDDAISDAIQARIVEIRTTSGITIGSNSTDDAIESTGATGGFGVILTTTNGSIVHSGSGDIESGTIMNSGVDINASGNFEISGSGNILASASGNSDIDVDAGGNVLLSSSGGLITNGGGDGDVFIDAGTSGSISIDSNNLGAYIDAEDDIEIGQTVTGISDLIIRGDLTADDQITINTQGNVTVTENAVIQTTGDQLSNGSISITSSEGIFNLSNTARIRANPQDIDNTSDITLSADSFLLNSINDTEIEAGGDIRILSDTGSLQIQSDVSAAMNIFLSASGGGSDGDIEINGGANTANITAGNFIDMSALDDIQIDRSTLTTTSSSIYLRANNDGTLRNDIDTDLFSGGNVVFGTLSSNGEVVFDVNGTGTDDVVWIAGENIFMENAVTFDIEGGDETDTSPINPLTGTPITFGLSLQASENIGTVANPVHMIGSVAGTLITFADANLSETSGGPLSGPGDPSPGSFSHGTDNGFGHLEFNGDINTQDGVGTITMDPNSDVTSGADVVVVAPNDIIQNSNLTADGDILLVSTNNSVIIEDDVVLIAGNQAGEPTGNVTLNAEQDIIIGNGAIIRAGENNGSGDIHFLADAAGNDGIGSNDVVTIGNQSFLLANGGSITVEAPNGSIDVGSNSDLAATQDIAIIAEAGIILDGSLAPLGLLDVQTGETGAVEGSFTLEKNGTIRVNTAFVIGGDAGGNSNIRIQRASSGPANLISINGNIVADGDVTFDLTDTDTGGLTLDSGVNFTGNIESSGSVNFFTQNDQGILGGGNIQANQVFTNIDGTGSISLGSITVEDWVNLTSSTGDITLGGPIVVNQNRGTDVLTADVVSPTSIVIADPTEFRIGDNITIDGQSATITTIDSDTNTLTVAGPGFITLPTSGTSVSLSESGLGNAFEVNTGGHVVSNGEITGNSVAGLNLAIDPISATFNSDVNVSGDIDVHATTDINVNAKLHTSGGRIFLRADDDGTAFPASSGADGVGDLVMNPNGELLAISGLIELSGENVTLGKIVAGTSVMAIADLSDTSPGEGELTVNGSIQGNSVTLTANDGGVILNRDPNNLSGTLRITSGGEGVIINSDVSAAGDILIQPEVTVSTNSTISSDLADANGAITFQSDIESNSAGQNILTISSGNNVVSVQGIGSTRALGSLVIDSERVALNGAITTEGSTVITTKNGNDINIASANITSNSGNIRLNADGTITNLGGNSTLAAIFGTVDLSAAGGIGNSTDGQINTDALFLQAKTNDGEIAVTEADGIHLASGGLINQGVDASDDIVIVAGGTINLSNSPVTTRGGDIAITTSGSTSKILNSNIVSEQSTTLLAGGDIIEGIVITGTTTSITSTSGTIDGISISSDSDILVSALAETIQNTDASGTSVMLAADESILGSSAISTASNVTLIADDGEITDVLVNAATLATLNANDTDGNGQGGLTNIQITANGDGVANTNDITLASGGVIANVVATTNGNGAIEITSADRIEGGIFTADTIDFEAINGIGTENQVTLAGVENVTLSNTTSEGINVQNSSGNAVTVNVDALGSGDLTFAQTGEGALEITNLTTANGAINLTSNSSTNIQSMNSGTNGNIDVEISGGQLTVQNMGVSANGTGAIQLVTQGRNDNIQLTSQVSSGSGDISIQSGAAIAIQNNITTAGEVNLLSAGGPIAQSSGTINAASLRVNSRGGITGITSSISNLSATNAGGGDTTITNTGNLVIAGLVSNGVGAITLTNTGTVESSGMITNSGGMVEISASGPITIGKGGINAFDDITLTTGNNLLAGEDDSLRIQGEIRSTNSGLITLTAGDNDILVNADVETGGNIHVSTEMGTDGGGRINGTGLLSGNTVTLTSLAGVQANTKSQSLSAIGGTGDITILENDSVTLAGVVGLGSIEITSNNGRIDTGTQLINSGGGSISLTANGEGNDILVNSGNIQANTSISLSSTNAIVLTGSTTAGTSATMQARSGSISGNGLITALDADLNADTGIMISTSVTNVAASNSTTGDLVINEADGLTIHSNGISVSGNGNISLTLADGALLVDSALVADGSGEISLTTAGAENDSITLNAQVTSDNGTITFNSADELALNHEVNSRGPIHLSSANEISVGSTLHSGSDVMVNAGGAITRVAESNVITGDFIQMAASGGITASIEGNTLQAQNNTSGNIDISERSSIRIVGTGVNNTFDGGELSIKTVGNLLVDSPVNSENGLVTLETQNEGSLTINSSIRSGNAQIELAAVSDVEINHTITTTGNLSIDSVNGGIITSDANHVISANFLDLSGSEGMNVFTTVTEIQAENSGQGAILITETDGLQIVGEGISNAGIGGVNLTTLAGAMLVNSPIFSNQTGSISLTSNTNSLEINNTITSTSGKVLIRSQEEIEVNDSISTAKDIYLLSDTDNSGEEALSINAQILGKTVTLTANSGQIFINADPNNTRGSLTFESASESLDFGVQLNANLTAKNGIDFNQITNRVQIIENVTIASEFGSIIFGGAIENDGVGDEENLELSTINDGTITLGQVGRSEDGMDARMGNLTVNTQGMLILKGSIDTNQGLVDFTGVENVELGTDVSINTSNNEENINNGEDIMLAMGSENPNLLDKGFVLTLDAGENGNINVDNISGLTGFIIEDIDTVQENFVGANDVTFGPSVEVNGPVLINAGGTVIGGPTTSGGGDGGFTLTVGRVVISNEINQSGNIFITATGIGQDLGDEDGDIIIGAPISTQSGEIRLVADDDIVFQSEGQLSGTNLVRLTANDGNSDQVRGVFELQDSTEVGTSDEMEEITAGDLVIVVNGENGFIGQGTNPDMAVAINENNSIEVDVTSSLTIDAPGSNSINIRGINNLVISDADDDAIDSIQGGLRGGSSIITLSAVRDIIIGDIITDHNVFLTAGGAINDEVGIDEDVDILAAEINLAAGEGVGNALARLELNSNTGVSGDLTITNSEGEMNILTLANLGQPTNITVENASGNIVLEHRGNEIVTVASTTKTADSTLTILSQDEVVVNHFSDQTTRINLTTTNTDANINFTQNSDSAAEAGRIEVFHAQTSGGDIFMTTNDSADLSITSIQTESGTLNLDIDGSITDQGEPTDRLEAMALNITAAQNVGSEDNELNTMVQELRMNNVNENSFLVNAGNLSILDSNTQVLGSLDIRTEGDLIVDGELKVEGIGQSLRLQTLGQEKNLIINSRVESTQSIELNASGSIENTEQGIIGTSLVGGSVRLIATDLVQDGTITTVSSLNNTDDSVTLNLSGTIIDETGLNTAIQSSTLIIEDAENIGDDRDGDLDTAEDGWLDLDVATLIIDSGVQGGIYLLETDDIHLESIELSAISEDNPGLFVLHTSDQNIGSMSIGNIDLATGNINLNASGSITDYADDEVIDIVANEITLTSTSGIGNDQRPLEINAEIIRARTSGSNSAIIDLKSIRDLATTVESLSTQGNGSSISFEQSGGGKATFNDVTTFGDADITLNSDQSIEVGNIMALGATITINSDDEIQELNDDPEADLSAQEVILTAVNGIGKADSIDVDSMAISAFTSGQINTDIDLNSVSKDEVSIERVIAENGDVRISSINDVIVKEIETKDNQNALNSVFITSTSGNIRLGDINNTNKTSINSDSQAILTASASILDETNTNATKIITNGTIDLSVGEKIGQLNNPLEVHADENLNLSFKGNGVQRPVWASLGGLVEGSKSANAIEFLGATSEPPGLLVWNGNIVGGGNENLREFDRAQNFFSEVQTLTPAQAVLAPAFFRHVTVSMNDLWKIPDIEHINTGGGFIFGLPRDLNLPSSSNVNRTQDESYRWDTLPKKKKDRDMSFAR